MPIEDTPWNVGLIVGPSGSGKSSILKHIFGDMQALTWGAKSVIDDFKGELGLQDIADVCSSVGFNTIPAWLRPFAVLSNGEKFRAEMARRLLELPDPIIVDEFTSVVDRQVAQIGAHAIQKYVRKHNRQFVAATCHYDVIDWLQPDWIFEPATMQFTRRSLRQRPPVAISIAKVSYEAWRLFAPYHYMSKDLHKAAQCFALFVDDRVASFAGMLRRPHPKVKNIMGCSRLVTLPDWQGLGLAMILIDHLSAAYKAIGERVHTYPAHPDLIRTFGKSANWRMDKKPGTFSPKQGRTTTIGTTGAFGGRPCAVFEYTGAAMQDSAEARKLLGK